MEGGRDALRLILNPNRQTINPVQETRNRNPKPETRNLNQISEIPASIWACKPPKPETLTPKPSFRNPKSETQNLHQISEIPASIGACKNLKEISAGGNQIEAVCVCVCVCKGGREVMQKPLRDL